MIALFILIVVFIIVASQIDIERESMTAGSKRSVVVDKTVVINLDRDKRRYKNVKKRCRKAEIRFDRYSAIDGRNLDLHQLESKGLLKLSPYSFFNHNSGGRDSLKGSIGCALTHRQIWRELADSLHQTCLILEDDVEIPSDFWKRFNEIEIPNDWDIVFLGGVRIYGKPVHNNLIRAVSTKSNYWNNCGLYAYLINKRSAKRLLDMVDTVQTYLDIQMNRFYNKLKVYYIVPNIVKHDFSVKSSRSTGSSHKKGYFYSKSFIDRSKSVITI